MAVNGRIYATCFVDEQTEVRSFKYPVNWTIILALAACLDTILRIC